MSTSNSRFGCLGIFVVVVLVLSLGLNLMLMVGMAAGGGGVDPRKKFNERVLTEGDKAVKSKIAVIRIAGVISSMVKGYEGETMVEDIQLQLKQAIDDKDVVSIVLAIDSPGGEVTASDIIYNAVKRAAAVKPVVVSMGSMAASGGYYIACGGSYIFSHDTTFTGSIGVIMQSLNYTDLMGKVGLDVVTFKSGKFKDMLSGSRKLTPEESEYLQAMIMQTYGKFVGIVATSRGLDEAALRAGVADGRVLTGKDAAQEKLVDAIGELEDATKKAAELGKVTGAIVVRYETRQTLTKLLRVFEKADSKKLEVSIGRTSDLQLEAGRLYYLPGVLVP